VGVGPHHNCFFYYRGPSAKSDELESERFHQQVEDNTTKALVNTLEHSEGSVAASFLQCFAPQLSEILAPPLELHLQHAPAEVVHERALVLGISTLGEIDPATRNKPAGKGRGRVDAAIRSPGRAALLVENKTVDYLDGEQLARHARDWRVEGEPLLTTWTAIYQWALSSRRGQEEGSRSAFLLDQFLEYLEIVGFAPWAGFRAEDFAFFTNPTPERQVVVRNKMSALWKRVFDELPDHERDLLGVIHAGRVGRTRNVAWAQTNRGQSGCNLTVELRGEELQLNAVGWTNPQARAMERWLRRRPRLPRGAELVVWERIASTTATGKPWWMGAQGTEMQRFSAEELLAGGFDEWRARWLAVTDQTRRKLAFHLRRTRSRAEVLGLDDLPRELVADVRALLGPLREINRWA